MKVMLRIDPLNDFYLWPPVKLERISPEWKQLSILFVVISWESEKII